MKSKKHIGQMCLLAMMLVCFCMAVGSSKTTLYDFKTDLIHLEKPITKEQAQEILQSELKEEIDHRFAFFGIKKDEFVQNEDLYRMAQADVYQIIGDSDLVLNSNHRLLMDDTKGCLIDEELSYQLFGSLNVIGKSIKYGDNEFIIRGILKDCKNVILIPFLTYKEELLHSIAVEIPSADKRSEIHSDLRNRYDFGEENISPYIYSDWGRNLVKMLGFCIGLGVVIPVFKYSMKYKSYPVLQYAGIAYCILTVLLLIFILKVEFKLPLEMIPSKWSDFSFWSRLGEEKIKQFTYMFQAEKSTVELIHLQSFIETCKYSILTFLFYKLGVNKIKIETTKQLFLAVIFSLFVSFIGIICSVTHYQIPMLDEYYIWLLPVFYLSGKLVIRNLGRSNKINTNPIIRN